MQATLDARRPFSQRPPYRRYLAPLFAVLALLLFLSIPMPLSQKAHTFLHGICAQRPSHTLALGSGLLPFDARMTGIYTGFLCAFVALVVTGRHRYAGLPSLSSGVILLAFVGSMAIDGFNSLFSDLGISTFYETRSIHRLLTGMAAGVALATMLAMLIGMSLWRRPQVNRRVVGAWWHPVALYAAGLPVLLLMMSGWSFLLAPATIFMVVSAVVAFAGLAVVTIAMALGRENSFDRAAEMQPIIVAGTVAGIVVIGLLAAGRFGLEAWTNAPPLS